MDVRPLYGISVNKAAESYTFLADQITQLSLFSVGHRGSSKIIRVEHPEIRNYD